MRKHEKNYEIEESIQENTDFSKISESLVLPKTDTEVLQYDISTSHQGDLLLQIKKDRNRFLKMILFALLLHLSAVTLFKIVVYIPRSDLQYLDIRVVQADTDKTTGSILTSRLKLSKNLEDDNKNNEFDINDLKQSSGFELPKIEFEELEKLKLRRSLVEEEVSPQPLSVEYRDSWAQFGAGINRIRESITALSPFAPSAELQNKESEENTSAPLMKQSIGDGTEIIFRWINPPYNRTILFFPGLLEMSKKSMVEGEKNYDFMLTVLPDGAVLRVIDLNIIEDEMSRYIEGEIGKIRFEPLINTDSGEQQVTIRYRISGVSL